MSEIRLLKKFLEGFQKYRAGNLNFFLMMASLIPPAAAFPQVVEQGEDSEVRLAADFQLVLHKISEVSQAEGPDCLAGEFVKS